MERAPRIANIGAKLAVTVESGATAIWKPAGEAVEPAGALELGAILEPLGASVGGHRRHEGVVEHQPPGLGDLAAPVRVHGGIGALHDRLVRRKEQHGAQYENGDDFQGPCAGRSGHAVPTDAVREDACAENLEEK